MAGVGAQCSHPAPAAQPDSNWTQRTGMGRSRCHTFFSSSGTAFRCLPICLFTIDMGLQHPARPLRAHAGWSTILGDIDSKTWDVAHRPGFDCMTRRPHGSCALEV